jgi:hypothetical protein
MCCSGLEQPNVLFPFTLVTSEIIAWPAEETSQLEAYFLQN